VSDVKQMLDADVLTLGMAADEARRTAGAIDAENQIGY